MRKRALLFTMLTVFICLTVLADSAEAQNRRQSRGGGGAAGPLEFTVTYGSMWGGHIDSGVGTFRIDTGDSWQVAATLPVRHGLWGELSYTRQGTRINLDRRTGLQSLTDMTVHYWQLGALQGLPRGNVVPYALGSIGLTYYSPDAGTVQIEDTTIGVKSATKFSMAFGVGVKTTFGQSQRVGVRAQFRVLPTIYDAEAGVWFGTGGAGLGVGGSTLWQYEVSGGVVVRLGG